MNHKLNPEAFERLKNSKGKIFYGMHFYPGVAQYDNEEGSFRVFVNEATIRKLNPSFAGRPVFVEHVEGVDESVDQLRNEADGWVVESFFNEADGKTWCKFILVTERAFAAVRRGYKLSNAYLPQLVDKEATWNGVDYQKQVVGGEFEHLAIVNNPRYEESVIMTPDEFKSYNEKLKTELYRLANSKDKKGENKMGLKLFKRQKLENSVDIENTIVELPKSKKELSIAQLVEDHDKFLNMNGYANGDHMVKVNDKEEMSVNDLVKAYSGKCAENEKLLKAAKGEDGGEPGKGEDDINPGDVKENEVQSEDDMGEHSEDGDPSLDNEEGDGEGERDENGDHSLDNNGEGEGEGDGGKKKDPFAKSSSTKNAADKAAAKKIADAKAKAKAAAVKNAHLNNNRDTTEYARIDLPEDQVARGKARYGSGN